MPYKIGMLLISTTRGRTWSHIKESYLHTVFIKSFLLTLNKEHQYIVYIGVDKNDRLLDNKEQQNFITKFSEVFKNVEFKFIVFDPSIKKGHVTVMWNIIHKKAYDEGCDYFYQCGDDICFRTYNWINDCIKTLQAHNNIGLTGPINNNNRILTQSFVSRCHMDIFGWFFPEEIINWCCDDWYNLVYKSSHFYPLINHFCSNDGGEPRYYIDNKQHFKGRNINDFKANIQVLRAKTILLANRDKQVLENYLKCKHV